MLTGHFKLTKLDWFCGLVLGIFLILNCLHLLRGDLLFHVDIARDFLVMEEMVEQRQLTLIGPRSGVNGIFHGPAWYYLNLPVFFLSGGNPVAIGVFWLILYGLGMFLFYYLTKKMLGERLALIAVTLLGSLTVFAPKGFIQCSPAVFLVVILVYFSWRYVKEWRVWQLMVASLTIGLLIQFQMAYGAPVMLLVSGYLIFQVVKNKKFKHLWALVVILLPLSTFILFDLRHDFLQTKGVINYLTVKNPEDNWSIQSYLMERSESILDCFSFLNTPDGWLNQVSGVLGLSSLIYLAVKLYQNRQNLDQNKSLWWVSGLMIFGFWLITIPFKSRVWGFYYEAMMPLICIWWSKVLIDCISWKKVGRWCLISIISINLIFAAKSGWEYWWSSNNADEAHWKFYRGLALDIIADSEGQPFGYFAFTTDQLAYQPKYALSYWTKRKSLEVSAYEKQVLTYLIIGSNDHSNPFTDENYWQNEQVKINRLPEAMWEYPVGYQIKKYLLDEAELQIPADPNLIDGLQFR